MLSKREKRTNRVTIGETMLISRLPLEIFDTRKAMHIPPPPLSLDANESRGWKRTEIRMSVCRAKPGIVVLINQRESGAAFGAVSIHAGGDKCDASS